MNPRTTDKVQRELARAAAMEIFVVYWNPTDYPKYVVRRFAIQNQPIPDR